MARRDRINEVVKILQGTESVLPGSLSRLTQRRENGRSHSYWYLTWKQEGKSRAIYIPRRDVRRVARAIENLRKLRALISEIANENLRKFGEGRDVRKRG